MDEITDEELERLSAWEAADRHCPTCTCDDPTTEAESMVAILAAVLSDQGSIMLTDTVLSRDLEGSYISIEPADDGGIVLSLGWDDDASDESDEAF